MIVKRRSDGALLLVVSTTDLLVGGVLSATERVHWCRAPDAPASVPLEAVRGVDCDEVPDGPV